MQGVRVQHDAILRAARRALADDPAAPVGAVAVAAGVSRATFYRYFPSRAALLEALDIEPDPDSRERILGAAVGLLERDGLGRLSMDELAETAGVSRASVYRIFPGKPALFAALVESMSPFEEIAATVHRLHDRPPAEVLPQVVRIAARVAAPRVGILRAIMFELTSGTPDGLEAANSALRPLIGEVSGYLARQMDAGTLRRMHPVLAAQALVGPLVFHLVSRTVAAPLVGLDVEIDAAAEALAGVALRGLAPDPSEE